MLASVLKYIIDMVGRTLLSFNSLMTETFHDDG